MKIQGNLRINLYLIFAQSLPRPKETCGQKITFYGNIVLPPTGKKWCITKNTADSFSNLGNGVIQMPFLDKLDIYGVKNRQIRYLWMLKIHLLSILPFPGFG